MSLHYIYRQQVAVLHMHPSLSGQEQRNDTSAVTHVDTFSRAAIKTSCLQQHFAIVLTDRWSISRSSPVTFFPSQSGHCQLAVTV